MVNIIFETSFSNKKNINFIIDNDKITWKTLFYFISKKIKIHPYFIYLQIGEKNFNGDNINYLKPFHYLKFNYNDFIIIKVNIRSQYLNSIQSKLAILKKEIFSDFKKHNFINDTKYFQYIHYINLLYPY
tara:strand:- start:48 stop:437 length:390 start_codon:yes stop_codon:yes gene_type:complete